ncbi:hypothetical protein [Pseudonocardia endophytica]|uniref:Uncharacterized protein n=1 Tax=Pseudonocardia endophytica TaxID=401976 RepID=A0A4R1HS29_PSEEN|nr:hypothetical protein [Pseudonocardia endophytica]TCK25444.1 hypothetical protein EV378_1252 [Pseudonocardia endophytica]
MHDQNSRPAGGDASLTCCGADRPHPLGLVERHADDCPIFEASRARRERDLADLTGRPSGWTVVRPLADVERADVEDATGHRISPGRRSRRRWSVEVRSACLAGRDVLVRVFRFDGEPCGAVVDDTPTPVGVR